MKKVGLITVGQSPRTDVTRELKDCFDRNVELIEVGHWMELLKRN